MGTKYYLAVDIGASSGRHMLAHLEDGKIVLEEIYRFSNEMVMRKGYKVWNLRRLFHEILTGMKKCAESGKIPYSMGIDTWAVDMFFWMQMTEKLGRQLLIGISGLMEWMRKYISWLRKNSYIQEPEFKSRYLIPFIS